MNDAVDQREEKRTRATALVLSLALYATLMAVNLASDATKMQAVLGGERPFGIPARVFFTALNAILLLPIFWWMPSLVKLRAYTKQKEGGGATTVLASLYTTYSLRFLLTPLSSDTPPEIRKARSIAFAGLIYFAAVGAVWIVLAARAGVLDHRPL
jgi:hypothetical protein